MSYTGRQDFGDGEGNLLDHVKAFADYYLHTEEGQQLMKQTARTTEEWEHEQQQMRWVLEEMLPTLQYFCNLEKLETAVLEEQEIEKKVPLLTQGDASRKAYQEAMLAYIRESRIALNTGRSCLVCRISGILQLPVRINHTKNRLWKRYDRKQSHTV